MQKKSVINNLSELEVYLQKNIPITNALGIKVREANSLVVKLQAPFLENINHQNTVFGGSLHALTTLACWSWLHINLMKSEINANIVIAQSEANYLAPVTKDFIAECFLSDPKELEHFFKALAKRGKARIHLKSEIYQDDRLCVDFKGTFVVSKKCLNP